MKALAAAIDAKDPYTRGHSERVTTYSLQIAQRCGLADRDLDTVMYAAILHDVGKIGVDEAILRKPDQLTPAEWEVMTRHPAIGSQIVEGVAFLREAQPCIRHHHEGFDGSGYPDGLRGEAIPLGARVIAVADVFDAITTDRPYRAALAQPEALNELRREAGRHLDPQLVAIFVEHVAS
jgi:HD-GYP domain-containing protein (c-di-GMP phosphodiesterase class II)